MAPARRGEAQGGFQRSALKPLLWGEPPAFGGVGGTLPPRLSPGGGNGKGGDQTSLLPQASARALPWMPPSRALPPQALMATQKPEFPFKDTRMPVSTVFENFESGASIEDIMEWFDVTREQIVAVLEFAARSLDGPPSANRPMTSVDAHSL